jgi:hypothetical protein
MIVGERAAPACSRRALAARWVRGDPAGLPGRPDPYPPRTLIPPIPSHPVLFSGLSGSRWLWRSLATPQERLGHARDAFLGHTAPATRPPWLSLGRRRSGGERAGAPDRPAREAARAVASDRRGSRALPSQPQNLGTGHLAQSPGALRPSHPTTSGDPVSYHLRADCVAQPNYEENQQ